jgi:hypothetical protein
MVTPYLLFTAGVTSDTISNSPIVVLECHLEQFDLIRSRPIHFNRTDIAREDPVKFICTKL